MNGMFPSLAFQALEPCTVVQCMKKIGKGDITNVPKFPSVKPFGHDSGLGLCICLFGFAMAWKVFIEMLASYMMQV